MEREGKNRGRGIIVKFYDWRKRSRNRASERGPWDSRVAAARKELLDAF